jgi:hypothetical protein
MRWAIVVSVVVATAATAWLGAGGCSLYFNDGCDYHGQHYKLGEHFPEFQGCNDCWCDSQHGATCTIVACGPDAGPPDAVVPDAGPLPDAEIRDGGPAPDAAPACAPSRGCPDGPACGNRCCNAGEQCVNGACTCGAGAACVGGDTCEPFGPGSGDLCGAVCCGVSGPCPD